MVGEWIQPEMGEYRAHRRELDRMMGMAVREAKRLESRDIGTEELLLAILNHTGDSAAAQALRDAGVDPGQVEALPSRRRAGEAAADPQFTPAALHLLSLAEGIAAGRGDPRVLPEHLLLAFLWDPSYSAWQLEHLGSSRERVRSKLAALGFDVPAKKLPAPDPRQYGPRVQVSLDDLAVLLDRMVEVLPDGASYAWNNDGDTKGWIQIPDGLDAEHYIQLALKKR